MLVLVTSGSSAHVWKGRHVATLGVVEDECVRCVGRPAVHVDERKLPGAPAKLRQGLGTFGEFGVRIKELFEVESNGTSNNGQGDCRFRRGGAPRPD